MKLSTKGRYGLRAMFELALRYGDGPVSRSQIAQQQNVPDAYLEQLLQKLKREGLVDGVRGAQGGYMLAREPRDISIGDVLRALEGPFQLSACVQEAESCDRSSACAMRLMYDRMNAALQQVVNETSLQDVLDDQYRINADISI